MTTDVAGRRTKKEKQITMVGGRVMIEVDRPQEKIGRFQLADVAKEPSNTGEIIHVDADIKDPRIAVGKKACFGGAYAIVLPTTRPDGIACAVLRYPQEVQFVYDEIDRPETDDEMEARLEEERAVARRRNELLNRSTLPQEGDKDSKPFGAVVLNDEPDEKPDAKIELARG